MQKKITKTSSEFLKGLDFPANSVDKESTFNAVDSGLIPRWGRSAGGGIGYPLQHSWASLVAQMVKNPSTVQESWVRSLGWEDPLEKKKSTHSTILTWAIPWTIQSMGSQRVRQDWVNFIFTLSKAELWSINSIRIIPSLLKKKNYFQKSNY